MNLISIVFPVFNEESNLDALYSKVKNVCNETSSCYEFIFVDNGSTDNSLCIIKSLCETDPNVQYLSLSRNFGHQGGLFAGLTHASGDAVITMDADLQHPPELIPEMIALWEEGYQVVYTNKVPSKDTHFNLQRKLFYRVISKLSGLKVNPGQSDFRLLDKKVLQILINIPEYKKFLRGTVSWLGFRQASLDFQALERNSGTSKFSYKSLLAFAVDGILSFSVAPLRMFVIAGLITATLSLSYTIIVILLVMLRSFHSIVIPPGWSTLAVAISFFGAIQLTAIGILGEYIGRIYDQTKGRPVFIVNEASVKQNEDS